MGKAKKLKVAPTPRHAPLGDHIMRDEFAVPSGRAKERRGRQGEQDPDRVEGRLSEKILSQAKQQAREELLLLQDQAKPAELSRAAAGFKAQSIRGDEDEDDDDDDDVEEDDEVGEDFDEFASEIRVSRQDEEAFEAFMNKSGAPRRTLADLIAEKIAEKKTEIGTQLSLSGTLGMPVASSSASAFGCGDGQLDPEVAEVYEGVGKVLARYRSGKVPKAFKVIAQFRNWEELLLLTQPDRWSAAAVFRATRIFTSGLKEPMAQRFFNQILLPRVRDDIDTYQRLNFHLYQALRKALFKPGAFFKGFLLPLCEAGDCTLREAVIVGSVLAKNSVPVLHASAVMLKVAEMEYSGANSIFLRVLFDKKYALPYRVVDSVVFHFLRFRSEKRELPVLWHQALLTFVQRYKGHVSSEQRDALLDLLKVKSHHKVTPEIRRELVHAKCRDDEEAVEPMM